MRRQHDRERLHIGRVSGNKEMAGATGLEPAASCVTGRRSNQLNYAPALIRRLTPSDSLSFLPLPSGRAVTGQPRDVTA